MLKELCNACISFILGQSLSFWLWSASHWQVLKAMNSLIRPSQAYKWD